MAQNDDLNLVLAYLPERYKKAYAQGKLDEADLIDYGHRTGILQAPKADFSNVVGGADTVPQVPDRYSALPYPVARGLTALDSVEGLGRDVADSIKAGVKKSVGAAEYTAADNNSAAAPLIQNLRDTFDFQNGGAIGGLLQGMADPHRYDTNRIAQEGSDLFTEGSQQAGVAEDSARHRVTGDTVGKIASGIASNPLSLAGVAGGPTSVIPSGDFFNQEYTNARLKGLSHDDALKEAGMKAGAMEAIAAVPAGSVFGRVPFVKNLIENELGHDAAKFLVRTGNNMAGEAVKMTGITGSGLAVDKANSYSDNDPVSKYANSNLPNNLLELFDTLKDSALTGAVMAGVTSPTEMFKISAEKGKLASDMFHGQVDSEKDMLREHQAIEDRHRSNAIGTRGTVDDMFGTPEGLPSVDEYNAGRQAALEQQARDQITRQQQEAGAYDQNNRRKALDILTSDAASRGNIMADALQRAGTGDLARLPRAQEEAPAPQPEPVQQELGLNEPLQPADSQVLKDQLARKRQVDEATGLLDEDNTVIQNKAKSARAAERRRYAALLVNHSRDMADQDARANYVADGMAKWDEANPLDKFAETERNKRMKLNTKKDTALPEREVAPEPVAPGEEDNSPIRPEENLQGVDALRRAAGLSSSSSGDFFAKRVKHLSEEDFHKLYSDTLHQWSREGGMDGPEELNRAMETLREESYRRRQDAVKAANNGRIEDTIDGTKQLPIGTMVDFQHGLDENTYRGRVVGAKLYHNNMNNTHFFAHTVEFEKHGKKETRNLTPSDIKKAYQGPRGLAQVEGTVHDTGVRTEHVFDAIMGGLHRGDAKAIAKHIADKNLVVVDDASNIPSDAVQQGTGGYYDGKRTYVVANQLSRGNIMGDLLNISAHEIKHAADFAAGPKARASLAGLIGDNANKRLNAKIEALAEQGDPKAKAAVEAAKQGSDPDTYHLELPAYFINAARAERDAKNPAAQLRDNVVAMVRNAAKRKFGDRADVNLKDVAYLSDKLLSETAREGKPLTTDKLGEGLEMIGGKKATGFDEAATYKSVDGNTKFVFRDADSSLHADAESTLKRLGEMSDKGINYSSVPLDMLLDHPELYEQYPDAGGIRVSVDNSLPEGHGFFDGKSITISGKSIHDAADTRKLLLHEVQHWVQDHEGHAGGSNIDMFRTPEEKETIAKFDDVKRKLDNSAAVLKKDEKMSDLAPLIDRSVTQREFLEEGSKRLRSSGKAIDRMQADNIDRLLASYDNMKADVGRAELSATKKYNDTLGEREARFTEQYSEFDPPPPNPEVDGHFDSNTPVEDSLIVREGRNLGQAKDYRQAAGLGFNIKAFQEGMKNVKLPDNKALRILRAQADFTGGLGRELNEMREDSVGYAALGAHRAMNSFGRINGSVTTMAREGVKLGKFKDIEAGEAHFKKEINDNLDRIAAIPDSSRRQAALAAWVRDNPHMRPVADAVNEVNQLSKNILAQMLMTHPDPTPAQLRDMNTIANNYFRYTTRMYAAFQGEAGREHSRLMVKQWEAGVKALAKKGEIPEKIRASFETYNNALKYLIDHDLRIPDREGMESLSTERLSQLYDTWVGNATETRQRARGMATDEGLNKTGADAAVRETMIDALEKRAKYVNDADLQGKAQDIAKGMLGLHDSGGPFAHYYRGFAQDRTILQHREHLPEEIRNLFGEIKDPATRLAVTIAKQSELVGRTKLLLDMRDMGEGKWVIPPEKAGLPGNEKFTATLNGKNFGPLNGWRTEPRIAEAIGSQLEVYSTLTQALAKSYTNTEAAISALTRSAGKGITSLAAKQKLMSVVFDLYNIGNNFAGSFVGGLSNGVINPKHYLDGLRVGAEVVADTARGGQAKRSSQDYDDAIRYGILDSARVQEIRATPQQVIRDMISDESKAYRNAKSGLIRSKRTVVEGFAMSDAWTKITAWKDRVDTLKKYYDAEGIKKSDEEIKREAADTIKDTSITYSRVPPAIRNLEAIGATTFMPYFYSVPRVIVNNYVRGFKDLMQAHYATSAKGKQIMLSSAMRRIAGATASSYGFVMLTKGIAAAMNDKDKDKAEEMKKLMQDDARFSDSVYLGKDAAGVPLFFRLSKTDAFGPVNDLLRVALDDSLTPEEKSRHALETFKGLFFTNRVTATAIKALAGTFTDTDIKDKKTKLERIAPNTMEHLKDAITSIPGASLTTANLAIEMLDSLTPGLLNSFDPKNKEPTTIKNNDPWMKFLSDMTLATGGRLDRADPNTAAFLSVQDVKKARDEGRKRMADGFAAGSDPKDMMRRYMEAANNEYLGMQKANDAYEGMVNGLDMTPRQASEVFKNAGGPGGGLTSADIAGLRTGKLNQEAEDWIKNHSAILSAGSMQKRSQDDSASPEEKKQQKKNVQEFLKMMKGMGLHVRGN